MNLIIDNYETKNFDISPLANEAFSELAARKFDEELGLVREAAQHLDKALAVVRKTTLGRKTTDEDLDKFDEHAAQAEEILDELGELDQHYYIRDFHEAGMINWYDIDMSEIEELDEPDMVFDEYDDEEDDIDIDDIDDFPEVGESEYGAPEELDFEEK
jgi:hypothetical protein